MEPNYSSAIILNNLVKAYNQALATQNISQSIKDFCLSNKTSTDVLTLNYGLSKFSTNNNEFQDSLFVLGKGVYSSTLSSNYLEIPNSNDNELAFYFNNIYDLNDDISNCYLLGKIYLTSSESNYSINFVLAKPLNEVDGNVIILHKDITLNEAYDILQFSTSLTFPLPEAVASNNVLLYDFILSVDEFTDNSQTDRYFIYLFDKRTPKGLFGLADENLYTAIISKIILGHKEIINLIDVELNNIKQLIQAWIDLESWTPDFVTYWQLSIIELPSELKSFIENELNIIIGYSLRPSSITSTSLVSGSGINVVI